MDSDKLPEHASAESLPSVATSPRQNLLSVDVEDYFHATGLCARTPGERWESLPGRVEYSTRLLLRVLDEHDVQATFFVLGWVAKRYPDLIREIAAARHEIASHGWSHELVYNQSREEFAADVTRAKGFLEDLSGTEVLGYHAPSFTITPRTYWALESLAEAGYRYDSSIFPIRRSRYGDPSSPRGIHWILPPGWHNQGLLDVPPATIRVRGHNLPVAGGGYLRAYPLAVTRWAIQRINNEDKRPAVVYLHPWELDPEQPRMPASFGNRFRHYLNLHRTQSRLVALLEQSDFQPIGAALAAAGLTDETAAQRLALDLKKWRAHA